MALFKQNEVVEYQGKNYIVLASAVSANMRESLIIEVDGKVLFLYNSEVKLVFNTQQIISLLKERGILQ